MGGNGSPGEGLGWGTMGAQVRGGGNGSPGEGVGWGAMAAQVRG